MAQGSGRKLKLSPFSPVCLGRVLPLSKPGVCCRSVNHSSWGGEVVARDFFLRGQQVKVHPVWVRDQQRISVILSGKFVQSTRIQKSVPQQPGGSHALGRPGHRPCFTEVISGAVEAAGSAEGALGPP